MKKSLLSLIALASIALSAQAQNATVGCLNPCDKKVIVESGPFIGVRIVNIPNSKFVRVLEIIPNTAASKNNIQLNDIIVSFEGVDVLSNQHLISMVATHQPGDKVTIAYNHDGKLITKKIILSALQTKEVVVKGCCDEPKVEVAAPTASELPSKMIVALNPNPASDKITVASSDELNGDVEMKMIDLRGNIVKVYNTKNQGRLNYQIALDGITNGQYLLRVTNGTQVYVEKFVVAK